MSIAGHWYPPTAGTGGFLLANPPFAPMTESFTVRIRGLLDMRQKYGDQKVLDLLELATIGTEGIVSTQQLMDRWKVTQPNVSRRITNLQALGLIDVSSGDGVYHVHWSALR